MTTLPEAIFSVSSVRAIDRCAIEGEGVPGYTLMTRAGAAAVVAARREFPQALRWQVVCGAGNNAGDGYVVARLAAAEGVDVSVVTLVDPDGLRGDAAIAYRDYTVAGGGVTRWRDAQGLDPAAELLVDAMLGSGLERDVEGDFRAAVDAINAHPGSVLAVDIPTGIHGDTGAVMGEAVRAGLTVTFVGLKAGLFLGGGRRCCGVIDFADLEIPSVCRDAQSPAYRRIAGSALREALPRRQADAHKGDFGHVLVVGGGTGMPGAVRMCGEAALRTGAGLVSIATVPAHATAFAGARPELMCHPLAEPGGLHDLIGRADVIAFGPGLGQTDWSDGLFEIVAAADRPSVWDADALNLLAAAGGASASRIITPHPGEAARLLGTSTAEIQRDRRTAVSGLVDRYGGVAVLKGAGTLVAAGREAPWLCSRGNPGMATAGMGDVLTGIIAGLLAQGLDAERAAMLGVEIHGRAGDAAAAGGERGLLASDLLAELRGIVNPCA